MKYLLAIDQGTTGTTALLIDKESKIEKKEGHISIINYSFGKIRDGFTFY